MVLINLSLSINAELFYALFLNLRILNILRLIINLIKNASTKNIHHKNKLHY